MTVQSYDRHLVLACSGTQRQSFAIYVKAVLPAIAYMAGHAADSDVPMCLSVAVLSFYIFGISVLPFPFLPFLVFLFTLWLCDLWDRIFRKGNRPFQSCQCRHTAASDTQKSSSPSVKRIFPVQPCPIVPCHLQKAEKSSRRSQTGRTEGNKNNKSKRQ